MNFLPRCHCAFSTPGIRILSQRLSRDIFPGNISDRSGVVVNDKLLTELAIVISVHYDADAASPPDAAIRRSLA